MKLYHATFQSYLSSIQENGLLPDFHKNWGDCAQGFVYLANNKDSAVSFCETAEDTPAEIFDSGICCFEIDSDNLDITLLSVDPNILLDGNETPWCFVYADNIPYNALHLCLMDDLGNIKPSLNDKINSAATRTIGSFPSSGVKTHEQEPNR